MKSHSFIRNQIVTRHPIPFIGIYDTFSASLAAAKFPALFVSGFGFGASHHGLPDEGFITWTDLVDFVRRILRVAPETPLLVDIDDGFGDSEVAAHVARTLNEVGAFGIVLEDQKRPRKCGHLEGKQVLPLDEYLAKLARVLDESPDLMVVARTDATDEKEIVARVKAFEAAGADAVLADGITSLETLKRIRSEVTCPLGFNQIAGGKSPEVSIPDLDELGVSIVIYSTPCLFAAQDAIERALDHLVSSEGSLSPLVEEGQVLRRCNKKLQENLGAPRRRRSRLNH